MAIGFKRFAVLASGALVIAACAPFGTEQTHGAFDSAPAFGEAVKYNAAVQTINPDPVYPVGSAEPGTNGDVARGAAERYRKGETKALETYNTTKAVANDASSSGGSSGGK